MILTVSYANEQIAFESYSQLVKTMVNDPFEVILFDNHYPLNRKNFIPELCDEFGFKYDSHGENIGAYKAYNYLINKYGQGKAILYEGDNFPLNDDWHLAVMSVISNQIVQSTLINKTSLREMNEFGFDDLEINGIICRKPKQAVTNTIGAINTDYFKAIGGAKGGKYYGGSEISMWEQLADKWVFLTDFEDDREKFTHDWQYSQYKLLHAHRGLDLSFEEYFKANPERIENLANRIFG